MIKKQDDSKPEGFHREFNINAKNILIMCAVVMIVMAILINHFM